MASCMNSNNTQRDATNTFITELIFEDPEASSVETVKHSLSQKQGIPSRQHRLSFPPTPSTCWESFPDQIRSQLDDWKAIVYVNGKPLGRLVQPTFAFDTPQSSIQSFQFTFRAFHVAKRAATTETPPTPLSIPVDTTFVTSEYTVQLFGRCGAAPFALPFRYRVSGREAATKVSLHQQTVQYIQHHQELRRHREKKDKCSRTITAPTEDCVVSCGSGFESCVAVFNVRESPALLTSFVLSFIVLSPTALVDETQETKTEEKRKDMETVLSSTSTAETKLKDFTSAKDNAMSTYPGSNGGAHCDRVLTPGKVNANRGKKQKKKKTSRPIRNASGGGSDGYDRSQSSPVSFGYASMTVRNRASRLASDNSSDQTPIEMVDEILQSLAPTKETGNVEGDSSEKLSVESPLGQEDLETSRDGSSPENADQVSPMKSESENRGPMRHDGRRLTDDAKNRLVLALNDFDEDDVYLRRNRSVGSLTKVAAGTGAVPVSSGTDASVPLSAPLPAQMTEHPTTSVKTAEKPGMRYGPPSSPAASPHRLNFRYANGLLQTNGDGRGNVEDHSSMAPQLNGHARMPGSVYPTGAGEIAMDNSSQGIEVEQGYQRTTTLQALLQMGSSHQPLTNPAHPITAHFSHQVPVGNIQMPAMGHSHPSMQNVFSFAPQQQVLPGHHHGVENMLNLSQFHGFQLGPLLAQQQQQQVRGITPEPMRNAREEHQKHKDDGQDNLACFYMKPTNDLDRFLTETTPMLQLDPTLEPHKAVDQLTLEDVWKSYYECSMLGKEIPLRGSAAGKENYCGPCTAYYLPFLSGIQIFLSGDGSYSGDASNIFLCDVEGWPPLMRMYYEKFETLPPWFRLPLYDTMDSLCHLDPELKQLKLKDLHPASWFCVAWYPLYRIPDAPLGTRFLTFHTFHPALRSTTTATRGGSVPLAVHGLEWYNMADELWLDNMKLTKPVRSPTPSKVPENGRFEGPNGGEVYSGEQHQWALRIRELRNIARTFARGLAFRRSTINGLADAKTQHHDFEYFYERN